MVKQWTKCFICKKRFWPATSQDILCPECGKDEPDFDDDEPVVE